MSEAVITWVGGPVLRARMRGSFSVYEAISVGPRRLLGEVIQLKGEELVAQDPRLLPFERHGQLDEPVVAHHEHDVLEAGLEPHSAAGTAERQAWVADLADAGAFGPKGTKDFARSADWRVEADRILKKVQA